MDIRRAGSQPSTKAPVEHFTGIVRIDPLFVLTDSSRVTVGLVTFESCARSDWHSHPLGQKVIISAGYGCVQSWGGPIEEMRARRCDHRCAR